MNKKELAQESEKTKKAREKLRRQLEAIERKITPQDLEQKNIEIHQWIARHARHRIVLKTKNIALFDGNTNVAQKSKSIQNIAEKLHSQMKSLNDVLKNNQRKMQPDEIH